MQLCVCATATFEDEGGVETSEPYGKKSVGGDASLSSNRAIRYAALLPIHRFLFASRTTTLSLPIMTILLLRDGIQRASRVCRKSRRAVL